ncbi:MAG: hypothetical protein IJ262_01930 [Clostridia bacterium]|nr:hypothetical protein [Clostridia bacterium]
MKKMHIFLILIAVIVILVLLIFLLRSCNVNKPPDKGDTPSTTTSSTLDFTPAIDYEDKSITIPGVTGINLKAGQLEQKVDFFNPNNNPCYFVISLYLSDGTLIYKSDFIAPSEHINNIKLTQVLKRGVYGNCRLVYDCYALNNKATLNSGEVKLEINSQ